MPVIIFASDPNLISRLDGHNDSQHEIHSFRKYEAMLSDVNNLDSDRLKAISGLVGDRAVRIQENRLMVVSAYSSMEALDAASDAHRSIFADIGQYMTGQPLVRSGKVVGIMDGDTPLSDMGYMRFIRVCFDDSKWDAI